MSDKNRLISVTLDEKTLAAASPDAEHERRVAIFDLIEENNFAVTGRDEGPYRLNISLAERKLVFNVTNEDESGEYTFILSMTPMRGVIRDYFMICETYYDAIRTQTPHQIEAIDMARRGIHNEASEMLAERFSGKIDIDFQTSRRLFSLICALHSGTGRAPT